MVVQVHHPVSNTDTKDSFQIGLKTVFETVNGATVTPATAAALTGANVVEVHAKDQIPPTTAALALKVSIFAPQAIASAPVVVTGHLISASAASSTATLKVHHPAHNGKPAHDSKETFKLTPATTYEVHQGKSVENLNAVAAFAAAAAVKGEPKTTIYAMPGTAPLQAERVLIFLHSGTGTGTGTTGTGTGGTKTSTNPVGHAVVVKGHISALATGSVTVKVHHPGKNGKPATHTFDTFVISPTATYEVHQGKSKQPGGPGSLQMGLEVEIHGTSGPPALANRLDIFIKPPPAKKPYSVTGVILNVNPAAGIVQVNVKGTTHTVQMTPMTSIHTTSKGKSQPGNTNHLQPGRTVVIQGHTDAPNPIATKIDVKNAKN